MITYFGTDPMFGLPHASPFAIKGEVLLQMADVKYTKQKANLMKAPKGKMPWIDDDGVSLSDTAFIKKHLEDRYSANFTGGYDNAALAAALAFERMGEDHLYWLTMHIRWMDDENFNKGPIQFFEDAPALIRPIVIKMVRRGVRKSLRAQGIGRHTDEERLHLARVSIDAFSHGLGDKNFICGDAPCGSDASTYGQLACMEAPFFKSDAGKIVREHDNLMAYMARMESKYFGDV